MKKLPLAVIFTLFTTTCAFCTSLNDLTAPKPLMGRLGIGSQLESNDFTLAPVTNKVEAKNKYSEAQKAAIKPTTKRTIKETAKETEKLTAKKPLSETKEEKTLADPIVKNKLLPIIPSKKIAEEQEQENKITEDKTKTSKKDIISEDTKNSKKAKEEAIETKAKAVFEDENIAENTAENNDEDTNNIENIDENNENSKNSDNTIAQASVGYADLSLKKIAQDVSYELDLDETKTASDLSILWAAATERSETMKYTIYKLSNPDEDKPNESTIKKILKPIANFSTLAGASVAGDPFMATGALIGGGLVNAFMKDDKEYNYKFSKVSDADMVLLVRKIDDLQKKLLTLYSDYKTKEQLVQMTKENFEKREEIYNASQGKSKEELVIADVYYKNAKTSAQRAQDDFLTSRAILENLVGAQALAEIEKESQDSKTESETEEN